MQILLGGKMFRSLVQKELKTILQSPKFILSFITFTVLILLSFYFGISEFRAYEKDYNTAINLMETRNGTADSWVKVIYKAYRVLTQCRFFHQASAMISGGIYR